MDREPQNKTARHSYLAVAVLLITITGGAWWVWHSPTRQPRATSPVPASIARSTDFTIYYPDPKKLPPGYTLDPRSFTSPVKNGVAYSVIYGNGKKIVFSVQAKPSDNELQSFNSNYIPLRIDYQTHVGQAEIGAYHLQTLVSLPVINGPWIIITAPSDIDQDQLKTVLGSIRQ